MKINIPNLFIVGAPKAGTTSLYHYLSHHPNVYMCPVKEPNYFSHEDIVRQELYYSEKGAADIERYSKLFIEATYQKIIGEASVSYLFYPNVPKKIKDTISDAKIIIILRNPIDRGFSHYLMDYRLGYINLSFEDIVYKTVNHKLLHLYYQQVVELGLYYHQVKRYLDTFGNKQVHIILNEDMRVDLPRVISSVCNFLGISSKNFPKTEKKHNVYQKPRNLLVRQLYSNITLRKSLKRILPSGLSDKFKNTFLIKEAKPLLPENTRLYLSDIYRDDIIKLSSLIDRDLSCWIQ